MLDKENATYERMGIASLLPGMTFMVETMIKELERMRELINPSLPLQSNDSETPPKKMTKYWAAMTETQRSNEVKRRLAFRNKKKLTKKHYSAAAKSFWKGMSPEERSKEMTRRRKITAERKQKEHAAHLARSAKARKSALARWARQKLEDPIVAEIEQSIINGKESQAK